MRADDQAHRYPKNENIYVSCRIYINALASIFIEETSFFPLLVNLMTSRAYTLTCSPRLIGL